MSDRPIESYIREIERVIGCSDTIWLDDTYSSKLRRILETMKNKFGSGKNQIVEEYEVLYCYEGISDGPETITLQALSSQNVVGMVRNLYGRSVSIIAVKR